MLQRWKSGQQRSQVRYLKHDFPGRSGVRLEVESGSTPRVCNCCRAIAFSLSGNTEAGLERPVIVTLAAARASFSHSLDRRSRFRFFAMRSNVSGIMRLLA